MYAFLLRAGKQRREILTRAHKSYLIDFNTTMKGAAFPDELRIRAYGVERYYDIVNENICVFLQTVLCIVKRNDMNKKKKTT